MDLDTYQCDPGLCVIINNMKFHNPRLEGLPRLEDFPSGTNNEALLKFIFTLLGFDVKIHQNLQAADIVSTVKRYSEMKHKGAFFLIISSHGGAGDVVYGTDGRVVPVHDLEKLFHSTKCRSLAGIPKVFMIDACRKAAVCCNTLANETMPQSISQNANTDPADIMTIFASAQGKIAHHDKTIGSILIRTFVSVFNKVSADDDLTKIVKKVNRINIEFGAQIVQNQSTFCKDYYITRGTELNKFFTLEKELQEAVRRWLLLREKTIQYIREVADHLQKVHCGASMVDRNIEKTKIKDVQQSYNGERCEIKNIQEKITTMKNIVEKVYRKYPNIKNDATIHKYVSVHAIFFTRCTKVADLAVDDKLDVSAATIQNIVSIRSMTEAINKLREYANKLEEQMESVI